MFLQPGTGSAPHPCTLLLCVVATLGCGSQTEAPECPRIDELSADPSLIDPAQNMASITVRVSEPGSDGDRKTGEDRAIVTTLLSEGGDFEDRHARETVFRCDGSAEGPVEICVEARFDDGTDEGQTAGFGEPQKTEGDTDGDAQCVERECIEVNCPDNLCPVIERFQLEETPVLAEATVFVEVSDPDGKPSEVTSTLSASSGTFDDVHASEATYTCEPFAPNPIEICVLVSDGSPSCDQRKCGEVNCNLCPYLYSLSVIPSRIPAESGRAEVQVRAEDPDDFPSPLVTKLTASSGSFEAPNAADTFYVCDAPGPVQICVEASDEDCTKTECTQVTCP